MNTEKILVVGGSGTVASEIIKLLQKKNISIKSTTSKKSHTSEDGVQWIHTDLLKGEGVAQAFEGVRRAFLLAPSGTASQYDILHSLVEEAKIRKLEKVVLMTAMGVEANEAGPYRRAEKEIEASGLAYNFLRPNWFMQNFNTVWVHAIKTEGKVIAPGGDARVSFIDARDIAAAAVHLLTHDDNKNQAFTLTGPSSLSFTDAAAVLTKASGKKIDYVDIEPEKFRTGLLAAGLKEDYADFLMMIFGFLKQGYNAPVTTSVQDITGRPAVSFEQYAQDYKAVYTLP